MRTTHHRPRMDGSLRQRHCLHNMKLLKPVNELEKIFIEDVRSSSTIVTHTRCHSFRFFFKVKMQFSHPIILSKEPLFFKGIMSIFSCNRKVTAKIPIIVMQSNPVMFRGADNPKKKKKLACFENLSSTPLGFPRLRN